MTILQKIEIQKQNTSVVYLFKEGIFYKSYNEGAYMLSFLNYKTSVNFYKNIKQNVYSIGFPQAVLDTLSVSYACNDGDVSEMKILDVCHYFENEMYMKWRESFVVKKNNTDVLTEIKNYPLASTTPIEAYVWLTNIQKRLTNGDLYRT